MRAKRILFLTAAGLIAAAAFVDGPMAHKARTPCGGKLLANPHRSWSHAAGGAGTIAFSINNSVVPTGGGLSVTEVTNATSWGTLEWNDVRAGLVSVNTDNSCPRGFIDDGRNCISYEDPQGLLGSGTLAASVVGWYNASTHSCNTPNTGNQTFNNFRDGDVVYNNGFSWTVPSAQGNDSCKTGCSGAFDIDGIAVQEVGHSIGLDHSTNTADSMYGSLGTCNCTKQSATTCDVQAGSNLCY